MAIGIGNTGNIINDFSESLQQILGKSNNRNNTKGGSDSVLFEASIGGSVAFDSSKWTGNADSRKAKVRYGFAMLDLAQVKSNVTPGKAVGSQFGINANKAIVPYFLDIPPQSITQKEIFATNISATRKGIIVETEGVVFKDIIIQGTTGIFPGERGSSTNPIPNFADFTKSPTPASGVDTKSGLSKKSNVKTISGYEEFLRLRQFFLKYASDKVRADGNLFLIFINEKDGQDLIVEPLEFTMERSSKSPLTYNYKIVLKAIGSINTAFEGVSPGFSTLDFLEQAGNVAANLQATIQTGRAIINQSSRLLQRLSQAADQTINGTLRQLEFASGDVAEGLATVISLPEILLRNATDSVLSTKENLNNAANTIFTTLGIDGFQSSTSSADRASQAAEFTAERDTKDRIDEDKRSPIPRSFLENSKNEINELSNNLADFVGLGDSDFNTIKGRTVTNIPEPLKVVSDEEFILLGEFSKISSSINESLATNALFASESETAFEQAAAIFTNQDLPEDQQIEILAPLTVREVRIEKGDTLERIAQREYNDALRWLDIIVLNELKPPYIDEAGGDGVKRPGDIILVGDQ